jgi:hypothetical protein
MGEPMDWQAFLRQQMELVQAELRAWRRRYPYDAGFVYEEARAEVEGREPEYGPPIVRGATQPGGAP